jgi:hypothetical protein
VRRLPFQNLTSYKAEWLEVQLLFGVGVRRLMQDGTDNIVMLKF